MSEDDSRQLSKFNKVTRIKKVYRSNITLLTQETVIKMSLTPPRTELNQRKKKIITDIGQFIID